MVNDYTSVRIISLGATIATFAATCYGIAMGDGELATVAGGITAFNAFLYEDVTFKSRK